jgi:hypothetical protein
MQLQFSSRRVAIVAVTAVVVAVVATVVAVVAVVATVVAVVAVVAAVVLMLVSFHLSSRGNLLLLPWPLPLPPPKPVILSAAKNPRIYEGERSDPNALFILREEPKNMSSPKRPNSNPIKDIHVAY